VLNEQWASKSFWAHPIVLLGDVGHVKSCFGLFRDSVNISARLGMVCAECTTSVEIILGTPDGTPW
jgi:hypothetical protein